MRRIVIALLILTALVVWRSELFVVSQPGEGARPLTLLPAKSRTDARVDVALPKVPVGMHRLKSGSGVTLVHYWAPWERHGLTQAAMLDSLRQAPDMASVQVALVCFDPFPSVARYIARNKLHLTVLLDHERSLAHLLPCPSVPYTYLLDRHGRIVVAQPGEVDWFAPETRAVLNSMVRGEANAPEGAL